MNTPTIASIAALIERIPPVTVCVESDVQAWRVHCTAATIAVHTDQCTPRAGRAWNLAKAIESGAYATRAAIEVGFLSASYALARSPDERDRLHEQALSPLTEAKLAYRGARWYASRAPRRSGARALRVAQEAYDRAVELEAAMRRCLEET